jgi:hypothetical protein
VTAHPSPEVDATHVARWASEQASQHILLGTQDGQRLFGARAAGTATSTIATERAALRVVPVLILVIILPGCAVVESAADTLRLVSLLLLVVVILPSLCLRSVAAVRSPKAPGCAEEALARGLSAPLLAALQRVERSEEGRRSPLCAMHARGIVAGAAVFVVVVVGGFSVAPVR